MAIRDIPEVAAPGEAQRITGRSRPCENETREPWRSKHIDRALTAAQLRRLLGFRDTDASGCALKGAEVHDFTAADFEQDREKLRQIRAREAQH